MSETTPRTSGGTISRLTSLVVHPFLFALYTVAFVYRRNFDLVPWQDAVLVGAVVFGCVAVLYAVSRLVFRNPYRAGLFTSGIVLLALSYGHVYNAIVDKHVGPFVVGRDQFLLVLWTLLAIGVGWIATRLKDAGPDVTKLLNLAALVLFVSAALPAALVNAGSSEKAALASGGVVDVDDDSRPKADPPSKLRDIVYIVPDDYMGAALKQEFGIDNSPFLRSLEKRGFYVPRQVRSNYPDSYFSLASTLNMEYLATSLANRTEINPILLDSRVVRFVRSKGYRWVYFPSTHNQTRMRDHDDVTYQYKSGSEFSQSFFRTTVAGSIARHLGWFHSLDGRTVHRNTILFEFNNIARARKLHGPLFVMAHILIPHGPTVFDAKGKLVTPEMEKARSPAENYSGMVQYGNRRLNELIDELLSGPPEEQPIILIQSEEGVRMTKRPGLTWATATRKERDRALSMFAAYYLPGVDARKVFYDSISPVNSFRALFDLYFDAGLPLLPDKHYGYKRPPNNEHGLEFFEVPVRKASSSTSPR